MELVFRELKFRSRMVVPLRNSREMLFMLFLSRLTCSCIVVWNPLNISAGRVSRSLSLKSTQCTVLRFRINLFGNVFRPISFKLINAKIDCTPESNPSLLKFLSGFFSQIPAKPILEIL